MALKRFLGSILSGTPPTVGSSGFEDSAASGRWTPSSILSFIKDGVWPTQGVTPTFVDDVFSTTLYAGSASGQSIETGIDLANEGGLLWLKSRNQDYNHGLWDTVRGTSKHLTSHSNAGESTDTWISSFNNDGFTFASGNNIHNSASVDHLAWTFRKAKGFFDVVEIDGSQGSGTQTFNHNLGSTPAVIIVKRRTANENFFFYHKDLPEVSSGNPYHMALNTNNAYDTGGGVFGTPDATTFKVNTYAMNATSASDKIICYLFASEDARFGLNKDQSIIKCGTYTGNGSDEHFIDCGFEPQWLLVRRANSGVQWYIVDYQRMMGVREGTGNLESQYICPNLNYGQEWLRSNLNGTHSLEARPTGFMIGPHENDFNHNGSQFIYIAIRKPMKVPTSGTEVYAAAEFADVNNGTSGSTSIMPDMIWSKRYDNNSDWSVQDRTRGLTYRNAVNTFTWLINSDNDDIKQYPDIYNIQSNGAFTNGQYWHGTNIVRWFFKRARDS